MANRQRSFVYQGEEDWEVQIQGRQYQVKMDEREKRLKAAAGETAVEEASSI